MPTAHAVRLPAVPSAEGRTAETHVVRSYWHTNQQNIDSERPTLLCFKIDPTVRGQATLTVRSRFKNSTRVKFRRHENIGECASACDQRHLRRSERSPLHDVRQHARVVPLRKRRARILFSRTSCSSGPPSPRLWRATFEIEAGLPTEAAEPRRLVEPDGIEPTTSCLQSRRSPN